MPTFRTSRREKIELLAKGDNQNIKGCEDAMDVPTLLLRECSSKQHRRLPCVNCLSPLLSGRCVIWRALTSEELPLIPPSLLVLQSLIFRCLIIHPTRTKP